MPAIVDTKGITWTYGAEHELADWDAYSKLPDGFKRSPDYTIVNSNGIAAQPDPKTYRYGGEINTPPTSTIEDQVKCLTQLMYLKPAINYRSNLHLHIRVPGLGKSLPLLKQVQKYIHAHMPRALPIIEAIPKGVTLAERKREKRRRVSHHTLLTDKRLDHQLKAKSIQEFFEREVPATKEGKPMWHAQPRLCVGLRQILQTDTVEFRHFPGTLNQDELAVALGWCHNFILRAFRDAPIEPLLLRYQGCKFPSFMPLDEELEIGYQATAAHNGLSVSQIKTNIALIEQGRFDASDAKETATKRARGLSR